MNDIPISDDTFGTREEMIARYRALKLELQEAKQEIALARIPTTVDAVEREEWRQERDQLRREKAQLAASEARLRAEFQVLVDYHTTKPQWKFPDVEEHALQALSTPPSDALKPLLEFVQMTFNYKGSAPYLQESARQLLQQYGGANE